MGVFCPHQTSRKLGDSYSSLKSKDLIDVNQWLHDMPYDVHPALDVDFLSIPS
jgi:hypothetical protein